MLVLIPRMLGCFGLTGCLSATAMVRPAICFVKPQTTTCSAFLLGQAQDVDFHCTGFWLSALGFRPCHADLMVGRVAPHLPCGARYTGDELSITQQDGLGGPVCHPDWCLFVFFRTIEDLARWHPPCSIGSQRLKVSTPRSESGGDNLPITLPMHPGEAIRLPRALYGTRNREPGRIQRQRPTAAKA